jgi:hypothetical protein
MVYNVRRFLSRTTLIEKKMYHRHAKDPVRRCNLDSTLSKFQQLFWQHPEISRKILRLNNDLVFEKNLPSLSILFLQKGTEKINVVEFHYCYLLDIDGIYDFLKSDFCINNVMYSILLECFKFVQHIGMF